MSDMRLASPRDTAFTLLLPSMNPGSRERALRSLARPRVKPPIYHFMFSERLAFGFPPKPYALAAHLALLEEKAGPAPWMIAGVCADIRPLIGDAVILGGHVRVGLEDAPLGTPMGNLDWVEEAVRIVRVHGAEPASAAEMRQALASITEATYWTAFRRSGIESPDLRKI